jgi:hypothetical protein
MIICHDLPSTLFLAKLSVCIASLPGRILRIDVATCRSASGAAWLFTLPTDGSAT